MSEDIDYWKTKCEELELENTMLKREWSKLVTIEQLHEYMKRRGWVIEPFNKYNVKITKPNDKDFKEYDGVIPSLTSTETIDYDHILDFTLREQLTSLEQRPVEKIVKEMMKIKV